jgi:uncharacterized DUF497 family protein
MPFDWDEDNIGHIALHQASAHEAEEAATYKPVAFGMVLRGGEQRFVQMGETYAGRVLRVVTTTRNGMTRVVTAHDVDLSKRKAYALKRDMHYGDAKDRSS